MLPQVNPPSGNMPRIQSTAVHKAANPIADAGAVSVSGGIAELEVRDDVDSFVARAEAALAEAKHARRGSVLVSGSAGDRPKANGTLHQLDPGEIVLEG